MSDAHTHLCAVAGGDHAAFTALYRQQARALTVLARGILGGDRAAAEDVVDATFIAVWQGAGRYQGQSAGEAAGWLRRVLRNKAVDWLRANARYDTGLEADHAQADTDPLSNPERAAMQRDAGERLAVAMRRLSVDQREAVMLCYFEDMALADIARIARCPEGTVKTRLFHARKALRGYLQDGDWADSAH
ncbi:MAG: RNA polymerase sigma factor [Novosphingobium sp.]